MDITPEQVEVVEETIQVVNSKLPAVISAFAGLAVGAGATYFILKKHLEAQYEARLAEEVEATKNYYRVINKDGKTVEEVVEERIPEEIAEKLREYTGTPIEKDDEDIERNVFIDSEPVQYNDWDYDQELESRDPDYPYVISLEEFLEADTEFEQTELTYYAGDDCLADAMDKTIDDIESTIGEKNLEKFGHGSGEPNLVHIRNERLEMDFMVRRSDGKYAEMVLGFIEHSDRPRNRKIRWGDDE